MSQIDPRIRCRDRAGTPFELAERDGMLQFAVPHPILT
jgi:hypothetical protein